MKAPQVAVLSADDWLANQLGEVAREQRWLLKIVRQTGAFAGNFAERRPGVAVLAFDAPGFRPEIAELIQHLHRHYPEVALLAACETKIPEESRAEWTAALLDLGCDAVLVPPLTRPVLEDALVGWMGTRLARLHWPTAEPAIDLAAGSYEA